MRIRLHRPPTRLAPHRWGLILAKHSAHLIAGCSYFCSACARGAGMAVERREHLPALKSQHTGRP